MTKPTLLLVDADQFVYAAACAAETEIEFDEDNTTLTTNHTELLSSVESTLHRMTAPYDETTFVFTGRTNFRRSLLDTYKSSRKRKPLAYWRTVDALLESDWLSCKLIEGLEADDVISIIATNPKYTSKYSITILSQDKDMLQVPGVTLLRGDDTHRQTQLKADRFRWSQVLTGDRTDGYYGLPGVGEAKAAKLLEKCTSLDEMIAVVFAEYDKAGISVADRNAQIDCACILRHGEYHFGNREPVLFFERQTYEPIEF